jgi:hypothetical protein
MRLTGALNVFAKFRVSKGEVGEGHVHQVAQTALNTAISQVEISLTVPARAD